MCQTERLCPKAGQAKRPGGVKKASVLMKDRDTKMYPIFLEDEAKRCICTGRSPRYHFVCCFREQPLARTGVPAADTPPCNVG